MRGRKLNSDELAEYAVRVLAGRVLLGGRTAQEDGRPRPGSRGTWTAAVSKLESLGYLDDKRFAENYAAARLDSGSMGKSPRAARPPE